MKIQSGSGPAAASGAGRPSGQAATGFGLDAPTVRASSPASPSGAVGAVHSLDALLALQEAPGPMERRKRAVKRAGRLLDVLDTLKLSILSGEAPPAVLLQLQSCILETRAETDDLALEGVLNDIETRAAVELAKQEQAGEHGLAA